MDIVDTVTKCRKNEPSIEAVQWVKSEYDDTFNSFQLLRILGLANLPKDYLKELTEKMEKDKYLSIPFLNKVIHLEEFLVKTMNTDGSVTFQILSEYQFYDIYSPNEY